MITQAGETIGGDTFVFACGPWLPGLFPDLLEGRIGRHGRSTVFRPAGGRPSVAPPALPAWIDFGEEMYGAPDLEARGFKIAVDRHGPVFDHDTGDRAAVDTLPEVRAYLARRFPGLSNAPLVGSEVCQHENSCNGDF